MLRAPPLPRTLEAALRDVRAEKPDVRAAALRDLVPHAEEEESPARSKVVHAIQRALREDQAAEVRAVAATVLADMGAREALPDLLLAVEDDGPLVRQMAIAALGEIGDPRATERLRRALEDGRAEVRFQAVMAFPRVSSSREASLDALLQATRDADPLVCHIALRMTEEVSGGGPPDERVLARARALLGHKAAEVRVASAILLARSPEARDRTPAQAILADVARGEIRTGDREDEAAAIELAGELGLEVARAGLEKRAFGGLWLRRDPLAWHARVALARMGHPRAVAGILKELGARDRDVRTLAVAAAGRARLAAARDRILAMRGDAGSADPHAVDEALAALGSGEALSPAPPPGGA
jgi:HEAT repeat protein